MTLSQLALEDVEALCSETSFLMADPAGPLLDPDDKDAALFSVKEEAPQSPPLLSPSPSLSPHEFLFCTPPTSTSPPSPPLGHSATLAEKAGAESLFMPWLSGGSLLDAEDAADDCKDDDAFVGMEWMAEKIDLSELDLDSLIGSCSSDVLPNSPEVLLPSLDPPMDLDLDLDPFPAATPGPSASAELVLEEDTGTVDTELEPLRPAVRPALAEPSDLLDEEQTAARPLVSPPPAGSVVVLVLADGEPPLLHRSVQVSPSASEWDSDSGIESLGSSPTRVLSLPVAPAPAAGSSRTKPYARPQSAAAAVSKVKQGPPGAPKPVEKKLKKMEQNKTAATRYRHKKKIEQDLLSTELEELEKKNGELAERAESISREIKYLKDLMEEVRKHHRGKTSSTAS
ncbi:cyclic AMP-dependent transcription factor ATF-4 [Nelusetta ayraudi]|uniref:cyclic AMP-dependent transcription factor ATF-4 n=1 Tax=Nelusetta ayraudi TaxID=303726 RepID=UPI003F6F3747